MNTGCGCTAESAPDLTPLSVANRSGLAALRYRVGTHASFFETMKARLSTFVPEGATDMPPPLAGLTTRDADDPAIAMLDAWALIADVLTFYQERVANEGYLRTAAERRSIRALAALVGYAWRPGVASSVYLAYGVQDPGGDAVVPIAAGHRVQSMPESGALPQSFETSEPLAARASWNRLVPRLTRPQQPKKDGAPLYFKGVATNLKPNDPLLFVDGGAAVPGALARVATVEPQFKENRTKVTLTTVATKRGALTGTSPAPLSDSDLLAQLALLALPPALHPRSAANLRQDVGTSLKPRADAAPQLLSLFKPALRSNLYAAMGNAAVAPPVGIEVYAFRLHAAPFGSSAPLEPVFDDQGRLVTRREWTLLKPGPTAAQPEKFELAMSAQFVPNSGQKVMLRLSVTVGEDSFSGEGLAGAGPINATSKDANETVTATVTISGSEEGGADLNFKFRRRHIEIDLVIAADGGVTVSSEECDPVATHWIGDALAFARGVQTSGSAGPFLTIKGTTGIPLASMVATEEANVISLDTLDEKVVRDSWVVIERSDRPAAPIIDQVFAVTTRARADYGLSGRTTNITLTSPSTWLAKNVEGEDFATVIRGTSVYADSERLDLTEAPIDDALMGGDLELDGVYGALEPGRWLLVEGERVDIPHIPGMKGAELVMLAGTEHGVSSDAPGETIRTTLKLASPLAYRYALDTVAIYGNVVQATHGELRSEVLGSGDAAQASEQFALRQGPLTYVSAVTPSGVQSTLQVRVNDVLWHEAPRLDGLGPNDRNYVTRSADAGKAIVMFGNGTEGARLPTGVDNIKAVYRTGIGIAGNVPAAKVNQLVMRPPGVVSVINPLPASGGADSEALDEARRNAPLGVMALDRLVSIQDYADFARTFAGVGKAATTRLAVGHQQTVYLTIGGADEAVLDQASDLCLNLAQAVRRFGDPHQPVLVAPGEAVLLVLVAKVRVDPDYLWDSVMPAVRSALLDVLGYTRRDVGQDVVLSEVISTIQQVPGVDYVDVDRMDSISAATMMDDIGRISSDKPPKPRPDERVRARPARLTGAGGKPHVLPAQIVYLSAAVASLLTLTELT